MSKPVVIDLYRFDPVLGFKRVLDAGIVGVIHKATEGLSHVDAMYDHRRKPFTDIGMKWGAYHFFRGNARAEADHFLSVAQPDKDTLVALDWEEAPDGSVPSTASVRAFLQRIEEKLGRKAVLYSGKDAKELIHGKDAYLGSHRLWLAQYGTKWKVQASWQYPWLWQNNGDGIGPGPHTIPGIKGNCDSSVIVKGTVETLLASWST